MWVLGVWVLCVGWVWVGCRVKVQNVSEGRGWFGMIDGEVVWCNQTIGDIFIGSASTTHHCYFFIQLLDFAIEPDVVIDQTDSKKLKLNTFTFS